MSIDAEIDQIQMNCPLCGSLLQFLRIKSQTVYYRCARHGVLMLPPDGRVRPVPS